MASKKKLIFSFLKLCVSITLLLYVLWKTDIGIILSSIKGAAPAWVFLAFCLHFVGLLISAYRWRILLAAQGIAASIRMLAGSYMVGFFFNTFLPTTVGGDISRAYDVTRSGEFQKKPGTGGVSPQKSIAVILIERSGGIAALLLLASFASVSGGRIFQKSVSVWLILSFLLFLIVMTCFVLSRSFSEILKKIIGRTWSSKLGAKALPFFEAVAVYRDKRRAFFVAFSYSIALQINTVLHFYLIGKGVGIDIPVMYFFTIVPLATLILLLPVSINGIGLRENAYSYFLGQLGVGMHLSIALSWVSFALVLIFAFAGGIIYVLRK